MDGVRSGGDRSTEALLLLLSAAILWIPQRDGLVGGLDLVGAERILRGEIPYRDFWTLYAPGHYYVLAGLLALFGRHWLVSGLGGAACFAVAVPLFHRLLRRLGAGRPAALLGSGVLLAVGFATPFSRSLGSYPPTLVLLLLAWLAYSRETAGEGRPSRRMLTGVWLGAAALFKHDVAAWAAVAMAAGIATEGVLRRAPGEAARHLGWLALGAVLVFAPPMLLLAAHGGSDLVRDLLVFPATDFRFARPERYPGLVPSALFHFEGGRRGQLFALCRWACFSIPLAAAIVGGLAGLGPAGRGSGGTRRRTLTVALGVAFLLHFVAAHVQINTHIVSMTVYGAALGAVLEARLTARRIARGLVLGAALAWSAALVAEPVLAPLLRGEEDRVALGLPGARSSRVYAVDAAHLRRLRALVEARVPPGEPIFVGEARHDIVIASDVRLYFLLDRRPATRYHELHPAVADTASVQREMVEDLGRSPPRLVLLRHAFADAELDAFKKALRRHVPEVGAHILDHHLREHYREIATLGRIHVLEIRGREEAATGSEGSESLPNASALR